MDLHSYHPGRPPSDKTLKIQQKILDAIKAEPGVFNAKLAKDIGVPSRQCSVLAKRLVKRGFLKMEKDNGAIRWKAC